jgi:WD40 repeat protein
VWLGRNTLGTWRAVKLVYRADFEEDRPYEREYEGIRQFEPVSRTHEHLVDILHIGRNDAGGYFYYVMELADDANGEAAGGCREETARPVFPDHYSPRTLRSELQRNGRLEVSRCVGLGLALARALEHLHAQGLVHRDVKPSNVIFVAGKPKLADIGLVTAMVEARSLVGTEGYSPPEGAGTAKGDIYGLGKTLYEAATGKHLRQFPEPPTGLGALPYREELLELDEVIQRACHPDPALRFASAAAVRADLETLRLGVSLRRLRRTQAVLGRVRRLGAVAAALLVVAVVLGLWQNRQAAQLREVVAEARYNSIRLHVANGTRLMDEGDLPGALAWFVEAMKQASGTPEEAVHRDRVALVLREFPRLQAMALHEGRVYSAEFSPDGRRIVSACEDGAARVWDAESGQQLTLPLKHGRAVNAAVFNPDGATVATAADDGAARLWESTSGRLRFPPLEHPSAVLQAVFSPDGRWLLTACTDGRARTWEAATGRLLADSLAHSKPVVQAEFSSDGRFVATASDDGTARVWTVPGGEPATGPLRHEGKVRRAVFSRDGRHLATASYDGTARVWSVETGQPLGDPIPVAPQAHGVEWSRDGAWLLAWGSDQNRWGEARVWDALNGQAVSPPLRHRGRVKQAAFSPDGRRVVTVSHDGTARLWDAATGEPASPVLRHNEQVWMARFSPNGRRLLTSGRDGLWRLWDLQTSADREVIGPFRADGLTDDIHFDGKRVVGANRSGTVLTWTLADGEPQRPALPHPDNVFSLRLTRDGGRVVTGCGDGRVRMWNAVTGQLVHGAMWHGGEVRGVAISPDERWLASASTNGTVQLWDSATGKARFPPLAHERPVWYVAFSPDSRLLLTCTGTIGWESAIDGPGSVRVWSVATGSLVSPAWHHAEGGQVTPAVFCPDSRLVAVGCESSLPDTSDAHVWDARSGRETVSRFQHRSGVTRVAFSGNCRALATGCGDGAMRLWDPATGAALSGWLRHQGEVTAVEFSSDSKRLLTASQDRTARLWDAATGEALGLPLRHPGPVILCKLSRDGRRLVSVEMYNGVVRLWNVGSATVSASQLEGRSVLYSGMRLDARTGPRALTPPELVAHWRGLAEAREPR